MYTGLFRGRIILILCYYTIYTSLFLDVKLFGQFKSLTIIQTRIHLSTTVKIKGTFLCFGWRQWQNNRRLLSDIPIVVRALCYSTTVSQLPLRNFNYNCHACMKNGQAIRNPRSVLFRSHRYLRKVWNYI